MSSGYKPPPCLPLQGGNVIDMSLCRSRMKIQFPEFGSLKSIPVWLLAFAFSQCCEAQTKTISGIVLDSASGGPLQNVSITFKNSPKGGLTDAKGKFSVTVDQHIREVNFSFTGYHTVSRSLSDEPIQSITVLLSKSYTELEDVFVNAKRGKYSNKNNPAVDLIRQVIAHKSRNGPGGFSFSSYEQYEKIRMFTDGPWEILTQNFALKKLHFFFENTDSAVVPGKALNSIYLQEVISQNYFRKEPQDKKKIIMGFKSVNYGPYIDMRGISSSLHYLYDDINIYDNTITAFTMLFTSPIANIGPTFYMYFIRDTLIEDGEKIVKLYFTPRNPEDLLFRGNLYITLDSQYAVTKVELGVSKHANLNYIRNFLVNQQFKKDSSGRYYLAESQTSAFFSPLPRSPGFYGERKISILHFTDSVLPSRVFQGPAIDSLPVNAKQPDWFWADNRPIPLSTSESRTYTNADSLLKSPSYNRFVDWATLFFVGYKSVGKFDFGPIRTFYSFNSVEGQRLQIGGRTNDKLSTRVFAMVILDMALRTTCSNIKLVCLTRSTTSPFINILSIFCRRAICTISRIRERKTSSQTVILFLPLLAGGIIPTGCTTIFSACPGYTNSEIIYPISWERNTGNNSPPGH